MLSRLIHSVAARPPASTDSTPKTVTNSPGAAAPATKPTGNPNNTESNSTPSTGGAPARGKIQFKNDFC